MHKFRSCRFGQSLVEYLVLLALLGIIIVTVVAGIGQRSRGRIAQANEALEEADIAARTATTSESKPPVGAVSDDSE